MNSKAAFYYSLAKQQEDFFDENKNSQEILNIQFLNRLNDT